MTKKFSSLGCVIALAAAFLGATLGAVSAQDNKKPSQLSERTVRVIMGMAFAAVPEEVAKPDGKMVKLDRSDPKKFLIPIENAREVIVQSVLISRAELCGLADLKKDLFNKMMAHQRKANSWSPQQVVYIQLLSATTETFMTGQQAVGDDVQKSEDPNKDIKSSYKCSDDEKARVKESVENSIKQLAKAG